MSVKVSIIMPCYNQGLYLEAAVNSVLKQTYENLEIIIVDDCSSLESVSLTQSLEANWGDKPISIYYLKTNQGVSYARNFGASRAAGKYLVFFDADDVLEATFIEKCLKAFESQEDCRFATSHLKYFGKINRELITENYSIETLLARNIFPVTGVLLKSDFDQTTGFDVAMKNGLEDWEFWIRFLKSGGDVAIVNEFLFLYRIKKISKNSDALKFIDLARKRIVQNNSDIFHQVGFLDPKELFEYRLISLSSEYKIGTKIMRWIRPILNLIRRG